LRISKYKNQGDTDSDESDDLGIFDGEDVKEVKLEPQDSI